MNKKSTLISLLGRMLYITLISLTTIIPSVAQEPLSLSLHEAISMSQIQSSAALRAKVTKENNYWNWRSFKADYLPRLELNSNFPDYNNSNRAIVQEDGTIIYRNVTSSTSDVGVSLRQRVPWTGGTLSLNTNVEGYYNWADENWAYRNTPISIVWRQPIFQFNSFQIDRNIEESKYNESQKKYVEDVENIALQTSRYFFNLIIAQVDYNIATLNLSNNDTIYIISKQRYKVGTIAENELLQTELNFLRSRQNKAQAEVQIQKSMLELRNYLGLDNEQKIKLTVPYDIPEFTVDPKIALQKAKENRADILFFERRKLEAKRSVQRAKRENGLNADLYVSYGNNGVGSSLSNMYDNISNQQLINIGVSIPLVDWGKTKAERNKALANQQNIEYSIDQDKLFFEQEVINAANNITQLKNSIELSKHADKIATKRYDVAKKRYFVGKISVTDMNLAIEEKDRAQKSYIQALKDFWEAYYLIRKLTLYDFVTNTNITL